MKNALKMLILVFFLLIIFVYVLVIGNLPKEIVIFQGEDITMKTLFGMNIR